MDHPLPERVRREAVRRAELQRFVEEGERVPVARAVDDTVNLEAVAVLELELAGRPIIMSGQLPLDDGPVLEVVARGRRAEADCRARGPELDALHGDVLARVAVPNQQQALALEVLGVAEGMGVDHPALEVGEPLQGRHLCGNQPVRRVH